MAKPRFYCITRTVNAVSGKHWPLTKNKLFRDMTPCSVPPPPFCVKERNKAGRLGCAAYSKQPLPHTRHQVLMAMAMKVRQQVSSSGRRYVSSRLHGVTFQTAALFKSPSYEPHIPIRTPDGKNGEPATVKARGTSEEHFYFQTSQRKRPFCLIPILGFGM